MACAAFMELIFLINSKSLVTINILTSSEPYISRYITLFYGYFGDYATDKYS